MQDIWNAEMKQIKFLELLSKIITQDHNWQLCYKMSKIESTTPEGWRSALLGCNIYKFCVIHKVTRFIRKNYSLSMERDKNGNLAQLNLYAYCSCFGYWD